MQGQKGKPQQLPKTTCQPGAHRPASHSWRRLSGVAEPSRSSPHNVLGRFQQRVLLETLVSSCLFQWVAFAPCWAHISHRSPFACPSESVEPCPCSAWGSQSLPSGTTELEEPGPEGGCSEAEQQRVDFQMGGGGEASRCPLRDAGSWLGGS